MGGVEVWLCFIGWGWWCVICDVICIVGLVWLFGVDFVLIVFYSRLVLIGWVVLVLLDVLVLV